MFGKILKGLRKDRKMSIDQLVEEINGKYGTSYSKSMVSRWENDLVDPKMETVRILADFFNVSIDVFLEFDGSDSQHNSIDAAHEINDLMNDLSRTNNVFFNGVELKENEIETLKVSLENILRLFSHISKNN
ncbi:helix-turn-helix transcriptional regulator [Paenibacillus campi]|uniref:helix-turn-helix domain-containing protein n=1 Tax=Paenibacillus campi TaxID=3106031 RepID=UPI002AFF3AFC|nr:helix-turn-helix transcriptional regulator [Paenibacillus sp. SGZ-1014]